MKRMADCDLCKVVFPSQVGAEKMDMYNAEGEVVDEYDPNKKSKEQPGMKLVEREQC